MRSKTQTVAGPGVSVNTKVVTVTKREWGIAKEMTVRDAPTEQHIRYNIGALETTQRL